MTIRWPRKHRATLPQVLCLMKFYSSRTKKIVNQYKDALAETPERQPWQDGGSSVCLRCNLTASLAWGGVQISDPFC